MCSEGANDPEKKPPAREQHGFQRTVCGCAFCAAPCRYLPGSLDVADLDRLCPPGQDVFAWAEQHLRALTGRPVPTLVPARQANGHCHWLFDGRCAVHENAPFSCAFFDTHMSVEEADRRSAATKRARAEDEARDGPYYRVWLHLCRKGLIGPPGDREGLHVELKRIQRNVERGWRRLQ